MDSNYNYSNYYYKNPEFLNMEKKKKSLLLDVPFCIPKDTCCSK